MNRRQATKVIKGMGKRHRLSTIDSAHRRMGRYSPPWRQPLTINGKLCQSWSEAMSQLFRL